VKVKFKNGRITIPLLTLTYYLDLNHMKRILSYSVVIVLFAIAVASQWALHVRRPVASPALAESALAAFGALRSLAAEVVWFRADRLQEEGRYVELAQLAHALTAAEPHTPEVWSYAAWNLAYNVSVMMPTPEDRWRWVQAAMELLRDSGIRLNPDSPELYRELAWLFELKLGTDIDAAAGTFRKKWRAIASDVAARDAWEELNMDRATMAKIEKNFGVKDRTSPLYSAIYWAYCGACYAKGADLETLKNIVRQSVVMYEKGESGSEGQENRSR